MFLRMPGCEECRRTTSGNCGKHGPEVSYIAGATERLPYLCPVCAGRGKVRGDFYALVPLGYLIHPVPCQSCNGSGVLWAAD